jgi:hypothetical protein
MVVGSLILPELVPNAVATLALPNLSGAELRHCVIKFSVSTTRISAHIASGVARTYKIGGLSVAMAAEERCIRDCRG